MNKKLLITMLAVCILEIIVPRNVKAQNQRILEDLDRGLIAMERSSDIYLSWRMLGLEPSNVSYHVYRNGVKITSSPITSSTNYVDSSGSKSSTYSISVVINGQEESTCPEVAVWGGQPGVSGYESKPDYPFKRIVLPTPPTDPDFPDNIYVPGDMNVGDLDGDGDYELVFEWESSSSGNDTHLSFLDAIDIDGTHLWRVNTGRNCDKLAHIVYDLDMDGKAEVTFKSAPGCKDASGNYLSKGPAASDDDSKLYARSAGRLVEDPAYITVLDGMTGLEKETIVYPFAIGPNGGTDDGWGDNYGHRASSIKACVIWVQGEGPLLVYTRGIYDRMALGAFKWDGSGLTPKWTFDTNDSQYSAYTGEGNHSLSVGDVDGDGSDEIIYGACAIDHDGTGLYTTGRGHGDSDHLGDHDPDRPGLEFFQPHENSTYGLSMRDAGTGSIIWEYLSSADVGRAYAADVYSEYRGSEIAAIGFSNYDVDGNEISTNMNAYCQPVYWDGDVQRELRNGQNIEGPGRLLTSYHYGASTIHGSKKDANLVADILGDWREEIIWRKSNTELLLFSTTIETSHKNYSLMHDPLYRMNIARQNIGYNQPAHTGYFFADGAPTPSFTTPDIIAANQGPYEAEDFTNQSGTSVGSSHSGYSGDGYVDYGGEGSWIEWNYIASPAGGSATLAFRYSNASSSDRQCTISVNGTNVGNLNFNSTGGWNAWEFQSLSVNLNSGNNTIRVTASPDFSGPNLDYVKVAQTIIIEENEIGFCNVDGVVDNNHSGYSGDGFVDSDSGTGKGVDWNVYGGSGTYRFRWRYANGSATNRTAVLYINGTAVSTEDFPSTGGWSNWATTSVTLDNMDSGPKLLRLEADQSQGLVNIDYIEVTGSGISPLGCSASNNITSDGDTSSKLLKTNGNTLSTSNELSVSPNPVHDVFIISKVIERNAEITIALYSANGQQVLYDNLGIVYEGSFEYAMDSKNLTSGLYILKVIVEGQTFTKKIIVL